MVGKLTGNGREGSTGDGMRSMVTEFIRKQNWGSLVFNFIAFFDTSLIEPAETVTISTEAQLCLWGSCRLSCVGDRSCDVAVHNSELAACGVCVMGDQ